MHRQVNTRNSGIEKIGAGEQAGAWGRYTHTLTTNVVGTMALVRERQAQ